MVEVWEGPKDLSIDLVWMVFGEPRWPKFGLSSKGVVAGLTKY